MGSFGIFPPSDCNSDNEAFLCICLGLLQDVEKGCRQDKTLANSGSCLKPFKYVSIGLDRVGALVVEGFNCINQLSSLVFSFITNQSAFLQTLSSVS